MVAPPPIGIPVVLSVCWLVTIATAIWDVVLLSAMPKTPGGSPLLFCSICGNASTFSVTVKGALWGSGTATLPVISPEVAAGVVAAGVVAATLLVFCDDPLLELL